MKRELENIVITSMIEEDELVLTGTELTEPYRLLFMKMDRDGNIVNKKRFGSGSKDYEGHYLCSTEEGFLLCGCSEGHAGKSGGEDWKAYILKVDESGNKINERSLRINDRECGYFIDQIDGDIFLTGVTNKEGKDSSVFVARLDHGFDVRSMNVIGDFTGAMPVDLKQGPSGLALLSSLKADDRYKIYRHLLDEDREVVDDEVLGEGYILQSREVDDRFILAGERVDEQYLLQLNSDYEVLSERTYGNGKLTYVVVEDDHLFIGGFVRKEGTFFPSLYKTDKNGKLIESKVWETSGLVENLLKVDGGWLLDIHTWTEKQNTRLITTERMEDLL